MPREKFQNNVRLVLSVAAGALLLLVALEVLLRRSRDFSPDFLASVLLYGLTVLNLTLLLVLLFVLGRNLVRVLLERRRGVLGARLRMQLLLVFLLMAVAPSVLLIFWGIDLVNVFGPEGERLAVMDPHLPPAVSFDSASGEALAEAALAGREAEATVPFAAGELVRVAVPVRGADRAVKGVVMVGSFIRGEVAGEVLEVQERYTKFRKAQSFSGPIKAVYLLFYLFPALLALFGAVWLSLYLARRITTPLRLVAEGAERIAAGERRVKVDFPAGTDEFAALIASFNRMSERLARSEEEVEFSRAGLTRKNQELEERRRLTETVLETVGTGVLVVDHEGTITVINAAAAQLLEIDPAALGRRLEEVLQGPGREEVLGLAQRLLSGRVARQDREVILPSRARDRHLAVTV